MKEQVLCVCDEKLKDLFFTVISCLYLFHLVLLYKLDLEAHYKHYEMVKT